MYKVYVCETVTGKNLGPLDVHVDQWTRELNGTDAATVSLYPGALTMKNRDWLRLITQGPRMTLVIEWNTAFSSAIVFAGPIWTRPWDGKKVVLNASGIRSILARRKALAWAPPYQTQVLPYVNMSLGSIAVSLVRDVALDGTKAGSSLPIVFPSIETDTDPTHVRNYNGYAVSTIDTLLSDLTNVINGPDIDFLPSWTDGSKQFLQYTMRVGTNEQPKIMTATQLTFDASAKKSSVKLLTSLEDASLMTTTDWALGSGDGTGVLMSVAQSSLATSNGWPLLEHETDYKTVDTQTTLDTHTAGDLAAFSAPTVQFGLTVDATKPPVFGSYTLGDNAFVRVANHVWIPDSPVAGYAMRIVKMSGDSSTTITMDVQNA